MAPKKTAINSNTQDIGYILGKMEMIEKKVDAQSAELELVLTKLDKMSQTLSFWRHTLWIAKALILSVPMIVAANHEDLLSLWRDF